MKKYFTYLLALVLGIGLTSFNFRDNAGAPASKSAYSQYKWYNYYGGLFEQCDPAYFGLDENNFPDCPPAIGIIYCEVRALQDAYDPSQPDLTTIVEIRYRPLL